MNWLRRLLARRSMERDLAEEIRQHLDETVDDLVASGVPREAAVHRARRQFGNPTLVEERGREVWRWHVVEDGWADLRYAVRQWGRSPAFALAAVVTLALGIGANTAVFSVVDALVLRPLPFPEPGRLVSVQSVDRRGPSLAGLSYPNFFDFRRETRTLSRLASYRDSDMTLVGRGLPAHLRAQIVSWDLFQTLGVAMALGRPFAPEEERAGARVVVLGHGTWTTHFGGDPGVVGDAIRLNGESYTVVGVAPAGFTYPIGRSPVDVWTTLATDASAGSATPATEQRGARMLHAVGRLAPGVSIAQAQAEMDALAGALLRRYPEDNANVPSTDVRPELHWLLGPARQAVLVLWGAVATVLLVACANVANLLVARTADRAREFDVRLAIGGSAGRILRQLVAENLLLAAVGTAAGVLVAALTMQVLLPLAEGLPRVDAVRLDARVFAFAALIALVTALVVSVPPACRLGRGPGGHSLLSTTRAVVAGRHRARSATVVAQIAVSLVLSTAAMWMIASFIQAMRRDLGFEPRQLMAFDVALPSAEYDADRQILFNGQLLSALGAMPGVTRAAAGMPLPLAGHQIGISFAIEGRPTPPGGRPTSDMAIVTPGYFATIGTALRAGRDFTEADDHGHPRVVIVNQAFADRFFPGESPIGRRIQSGARGPHDTGSPLREIVGVVGNARQSPVALGPEPIYYVPYRQMPWGFSIVVRTALPPATLVPALGQLVSSMDSQVAVHGARAFEDALAAGVAGPQLLVLLMGGFAAIALVLTATGLFGLLAHGVQQRTREIGVRMALGARRGAIVTMVTREAAALVGAGLLLGGAGALAIDSLLRSRIAAAGPPVPVLLATASVLVVATGLLSAFVPARRAAGVDPCETLRAD